MMNRGVMQRQMFSNGGESNGGESIGPGSLRADFVGRKSQEVRDRMAQEDLRKRQIIMEIEFLMGKLPIEEKEALLKQPNSVLEGTLTQVRGKYGKDDLLDRMNLREIENQEIDNLLEETNRKYDEMLAQDRERGIAPSAQQAIPSDMLMRGGQRDPNITEQMGINAPMNRMEMLKNQQQVSAGRATPAPSRDMLRDFQGDVNMTQGNIDRELGDSSDLETLQRMRRYQGMAGGGEAVPNKLKGFSKLPESVQMQMNPSLAKKYQQGGIASMMDPASMPQGDPMMGGMPQGGQMDPAQMAMMEAEAAGQAQGEQIGAMVGEQTMAGLDQAEDFQCAIDALRGNSAPLEARYQELAGFVGDQDAMQTPESVLAMVQPTIMMTEEGAVDSGIGQLMEQITGNIAMETPDGQPTAMAEGVGSLMGVGQQPAEKKFLADGGAVIGMSNGGNPFYEQALAEQQAIYGNPQDSKDAMQANILFNIADRGLLFAGGVDPNTGKSMAGAPLLSQIGRAASGLGATIGEQVAQQTAQERAMRAGALQRAQTLGDIKDARTFQEERDAFNLKKQLIDPKYITIGTVDGKQVFKGSITREKEKQLIEKYPGIVFNEPVSPTSGGTALKKIVFTSADGETTNTYYQTERDTPAFIKQLQEQTPNATVEAFNLSTEEKANIKPIYKVNADGSTETKAFDFSGPNQMNDFKKLQDGGWDLSSAKFDLANQEKFTIAKEGRALNIAIAAEIRAKDYRIGDERRDVFMAIAAEQRAEQRLIELERRALDTKLDQEDRILAKQLAKEARDSLAQLRQENRDKLKTIDAELRTIEYEEEADRKELERLIATEERALNRTLTQEERDRKEFDRQQNIFVKQEIAKETRVYEQKDDFTLRLINGQTFAFDNKRLDEEGYKGILIGGTKEVAAPDHRVAVIDGVRTIIDVNTIAGQKYIDKINKALGDGKQATLEKVSTEKTTNDAYLIPGVGGVMSRDGGRTYVDENGQVQQIPTGPDGGAIKMSDTIAVQMVKDEKIRAYALEQLELLDDALISGVSFADGDNSVSSEDIKDAKAALTKIAKGTGLKSNVIGAFNAVIGGVIAPEAFQEYFKDTTGARQFVKLLRVLGRSALSVSPRFAVADLEATQQLFPDESKLAVSPATEAAKLYDLKEAIDEERVRILKALAQDTAMDKSQKNILRTKIFEIERLQQLIGDIGQPETGLSDEDFTNALTNINKAKTRTRKRTP